MAQHHLVLCAACDYTVAPSRSCTAILRIFYPELIAAEPVYHEQAESLAAHTYELSALDEYLKQCATNLRRMGVHVHWAVNAAEACQIITNIAQPAGVMPAQVVATLTDALTLIQAEGRDFQQALNSCLLFATGPSHTADME